MTPSSFVHRLAAPVVARVVGFVFFLPLVLSLQMDSGCFGLFRGPFRYAVSRSLLDSGCFGSFRVSVGGRNVSPEGRGEASALQRRSLQMDSAPISTTPEDGAQHQPPAPNLLPKTAHSTSSPKTAHSISSPKTAHSTNLVPVLPPEADDFPPPETVVETKHAVSIGSWPTGASRVNPMGDTEYKGRSPVEVIVKLLEPEMDTETALAHLRYYGFCSLLPFLKEGEEDSAERLQRLLRAEAPPRPETPPVQDGRGQVKHYRHEWAKSSINPGVAAAVRAWSFDPADYIPQALLDLANMPWSDHSAETKIIWPWDEVRPRGPPEGNALQTYQGLPKFHIDPPDHRLNLWFPLPKKLVEGSTCRRRSAAGVLLSDSPEADAEKIKTMYDVEVTEEPGFEAAGALPDEYTSFWSDGKIRESGRKGKVLVMLRPAMRMTLNPNYHDENFDIPKKSPENYPRADRFGLEQRASKKTKASTRGKMLDERGCQKMGMSNYPSSFDADWPIGRWGEDDLPMGTPFMGRERMQRHDPRMGLPTTPSNPPISESPREEASPPREAVTPWEGVAYTHGPVAFAASLLPHAGYELRGIKRDYRPQGRGPFTDFELTGEERGTGSHVYTQTHLSICPPTVSLTYLSDVSS